ncbi:unnamed protein product [Adineta steineri]|uniref:FZ domain-containing protein n=1 Tax=Adineta steineri TaxID=433720 RepID=A0A814YB53_9BILA|nr:unnamed protein product [Adineta steineri]
MIVGQSLSNDIYSRRGSSALNRKKQKQDDVEREKHEFVDDEYSPPSTHQHDRYSPYGETKHNYRSRSRWPLSYEDSDDSYDSRDSHNLRDSHDLREWSRYEHRHNNHLSPAIFDHGPTCHSLLDPQYPLFSDVCGAVPQARYSLPNLFGHVERWQIAQVLSTILDPTTLASSAPNCPRALRLLLCPLLFPPCPTRYETPPILPCQPFCRVIKNQCAAPALDLLPCELLPPSSDLCPVNPAPYSSLLSSFGQPAPFNGGLPQGALQSLLAQSALSQFEGSQSPFSSLFAQTGLSQFDAPPSPFSSLFSQSGPSQFDGPSSPFSSLFSPSGYPSGPTPSGYPSGFPSGPIPSRIPSPGFSSLLSTSGLPSLSSFNPRFNMESVMSESLKPILVDFPPLPITPEFRKMPRYFPSLRSATEKV